MSNFDHQRFIEQQVNSSRGGSPPARRPMLVSQQQEQPQQQAQPFSSLRNATSTNLNTAAIGAPGSIGHGRSVSFVPQTVDTAGGAGAPPSAHARVAQSQARVDEEAGSKTAEGAQQHIVTDPTLGVLGKFNSIFDANGLNHQRIIDFLGTLTYGQGVRVGYMNGEDRRMAFGVLMHQLKSSERVAGYLMAYIVVGDNNYAKAMREMLMDLANSCKETTGKTVPQPDGPDYIVTMRCPIPEVKFISIEGLLSFAPETLMTVDLPPVVTNEYVQAKRVIALEAEVIKLNEEIAMLEGMDRNTFVGQQQLRGGRSMAQDRAESMHRIAGGNPLDNAAVQAAIADARTAALRENQQQVEADTALMRVQMAEIQRERDQLRAQMYQQFGDGNNNGGGYAPAAPAQGGQLVVGASRFGGGGAPPASSGAVAAQQLMSQHQSASGDAAQRVIDANLEKGAADIALPFNVWRCDTWWHIIFNNDYSTQLARRSAILGEFRNAGFDLFSDTGSWQVLWRDRLISDIDTMCTHSLTPEFVAGVQRTVDAIRMSKVDASVRQVVMQKYQAASYTNDALGALIAAEQLKHVEEAKKKPASNNNKAKGGKATYNNNGGKKNSGNYGSGQSGGASNNSNAQSNNQKR